ncbi:unnamed protein product [Amoebophrya sp. A25]|nr:unnamed protein product [Amoebophrya sp. A25]|eukprot:GSA25T00025404001.1
MDVESETIVATWNGEIPVGVTEFVTPAIQVVSSSTFSPSSSIGSATTRASSSSSTGGRLLPEVDGSPAREADVEGGVNADNEKVDGGDNENDKAVKVGHVVDEGSAAFCKPDECCVCALRAARKKEAKQSENEDDADALCSTEAPAEQGSNLEDKKSGESGTRPTTRPTKYSCPGCKRRTCSLACSVAHKNYFHCSGKRVRFDASASTVPQMNDTTILNDYKFLDSINEELDRDARNKEALDAVLSLQQPTMSKRAKNKKKKKERTNKMLRDQGLVLEARKRRTRLLLADIGLECARQNTSYCDRDTNKIHWRLEWSFFGPKERKELYVDDPICEDVAIVDLLARFLGEKILEPEKDGGVADADGDAEAVDSPAAKRRRTDSSGSSDSKPPPAGDEENEQDDVSRFFAAIADGKVRVYLRDKFPFANPNVNKWNALNREVSLVEIPLFRKNDDEGEEHTGGAPGAEGREAVKVDTSEEVDINIKKEPAAATGTATGAAASSGDNKPKDNNVLNGMRATTLKEALQGREVAEYPRFLVTSEKHKQEWPLFTLLSTKKADFRGGFQVGDIVVAQREILYHPAAPGGRDDEDDDEDQDEENVKTRERNDQEELLSQPGPSGQQRLIPEGTEGKIEDLDDEGHWIDWIDVPGFDDLVLMDPQTVKRKVIKVGDGGSGQSSSNKGYGKGMNNGKGGKTGGKGMDKNGKGSGKGKGGKGKGGKGGKNKDNFSFGTANGASGGNPNSVVLGDRVDLGADSQHQHYQQGKDQSGKASGKKGKKGGKDKMNSGKKGGGGKDKDGTSNNTGKGGAASTTSSSCAGPLAASFQQTFNSSTAGKNRGSLYGSQDHTSHYNSHSGGGGASGDYNSTMAAGSGSRSGGSASSSSPSFQPGASSMTASTATSKSWMIPTSSTSSTSMLNSSSYNMLNAGATSTSSSAGSSSSMNNNYNSYNPTSSSAGSSSMNNNYNSYNNSTPSSTSLGFAFPTTSSYNQQNYNQQLTSSNAGGYHSQYQNHENHYQSQMYNGNTTMPQQQQGNSQVKLMQAILQDPNLKNNPVLMQQMMSAVLNMQNQ